jgi:hypothetical protein
VQKFPDSGRQHCTGSPSRRGKNRQDYEAMGKSRGGLSTKIHAAVDALPPSEAVVERARQVSVHSGSVVEGFRADFVLADKRGL